MKKILLLIICLCLFGCSNEIDINKLMEENEYIIVDVRTLSEYKSGHLVDAINIPVDQINENINLDKNKLIFVYCKSGGRSQIAYETLKALGYSVYDLGGYADIDLPKE